MITKIKIKRPYDGLCEKFLEDMEKFESPGFYDVTECDSNSIECDLTNLYDHTYETKCKRQSTSDDWTCKTPTRK